MPDRPWIMTQTWHDLLFAHWPIVPERLRPRVPSVFDLDLFDDRAWISVVPFRMSNVSLRGVPAAPWVSEFPELNVRTYVRVDDRPGVYFFSLDAGSRLAVRTARALLNLPYHTATINVAVQDERIGYHSRRNDARRRIELVATYEPVGHAFEAMQGSLEYFLTERYCLYHVDRRGAPYRLEIHHPPWPLQPADAAITQNTMAEASGIMLPECAPLLQFAKRQDVVAWAPSPLELKT
jgi:uncharacterized protein